MIDQANLKRYAQRLVIESDLCSAEEALGCRILTLLDHAHNPEMILEKLERDVRHDLLDGEDVTALRGAVKKIKEG